MDPKLTQAFVKSMKSYFEDVDLSESDKAAPDRKYNKKYFDGMEEEHLGKKHPKTDKDRRKKPEVE
jgi:hypothetical protein